ncbi:MAG: cytochrome b5 domain-containing protein, partial [Pseudonocardiaceae bacterium]
PEPGLRCGAASRYLGEAAQLGSSIPLGIVRPPRFHEPSEARVPMLMLAAGSAPLRGILSARAGASDPGPTWLFVESPTDPEGMSEELRRLGSEEWLTVAPGPIASEANAALIRDLIQPVEQAGRGAQVYVCGPESFVQATMGVLRELGSSELVRTLVGERRLMLQVTPTHAPWRAPGVLGDGLYDNSELVLHNNAEHGYWFAIDGNVYDMTEFRHMHPGGAYIIDASAGMDASEEYAAVLHYQDPEINAMLAMHKIGAIRRLRFGDDRLHDLFRVWARCLFLVVEMQNAFENDLVYLRSETTAGEAADTLTPLKLMLFSKAQDRFEVLYYRGLSSG